MDKIWDRKFFKVEGHWPLWRGWKNRMTMQNRQKWNAKKKEGIFMVYSSLLKINYLSRS